MERSPRRVPERLSLVAVVTADVAEREVLSRIQHGAARRTCSGTVGLLVKYT